MSRARCRYQLSAGERVAAFAVCSFLGGIVASAFAEFWVERASFLFGVIESFIWALIGGGFLGILVVVFRRTIGPREFLLKEGWVISLGLLHFSVGILIGLGTWPWLLTIPGLLALPTSKSPESWIRVLSKQVWDFHDSGTDEHTR